MDESGPLAAAVAVALDDDLIGVVGEAIEGALVKLVRNSPSMVGHPRENTWIMLAGNDTSIREKHFSRPQPPDQIALSSKCLR